MGRRDLHPDDGHGCALAGQVRGASSGSCGTGPSTATSTAARRLRRPDPYLPLFSRPSSGVDDPVTVVFGRTRIPTLRWSPATPASPSGPARHGAGPSCTCSPDRLSSYPPLFLPLLTTTGSRARRAAATGRQTRPDTGPRPRGASADPGVQGRLTNDPASSTCRPRAPGRRRATASKRPPGKRLRRVWRAQTTCSPPAIDHPLADASRARRQRHGLRGRRVLDLACGTGPSSTRCSSAVTRSPAATRGDGPPAVAKAPGAVLWPTCTRSRPRPLRPRDLPRGRPQLPPHLDELRGGARRHRALARPRRPALWDVNTLATPPRFAPDWVVDRGGGHRPGTDALATPGGSVSWRRASTPPALRRRVERVVEPAPSAPLAGRGVRAARRGGRPWTCSMLGRARRASSRRDEDSPARRA